MKTTIKFWFLSALVFVAVRALPHKYPASTGSVSHKAGKVPSPDVDDDEPCPPGDGQVCSDWYDSERKRRDLSENLILDIVARHVDGVDPNTAVDPYNAGSHDVQNDPAVADPAANDDEDLPECPADDEEDQSGEKGEGEGEGECEEDNEGEGEGEEDKEDGDDKDDQDEDADADADEDKDEDKDEDADEDKDDDEDADEDNDEEEDNDDEEDIDEDEEEEDEDGDDESGDEDSADEADDDD